MNRTDDERNNEDVCYFKEFSIDGNKSIFMMDVCDSECIEFLILRLVKKQDGIGQSIDWSLINNRELGYQFPRIFYLSRFIFQ
jgi:hypothetical protein